MNVTRSILQLSLAILLAACGDAGGTTTSVPTRSSTSGSGAPAPSEPAPPATASPPGATSGGGDTKPDGAPYPIVLLHGMAGFDKLTVPVVSVVYFNQVKDDLAAHGESQVFITIAPPYDTSENRAAALKPQIEQILKQTGKAKVNLVGHSQGGMDARVLASPAGLGMGDVIASITTVATPHRGSRVADAVLGILEDVPPEVIDDVTGAALQILEKTAYEVENDPHLRAQLVELSEKYMTTTFNPTYGDDPRVTYASYGGRTNFEDGQPDCGFAMLPDDPKKVGAAQALLYTTAVFLENGNGVANDGLVTVESSRWGTFLKCVPADHLQEVGQLMQSGSDPVSDFDHLVFFRELVGRIRASGN